MHLLVLLAALLAQRSAGADWVLRMWMEHFRDQLTGLRAEESSLQDQLRSLSDAPEKDKGAKGGSKENPKEREEALNKKLLQVRRQLLGLHRGKERRKDRKSIR